MRRICGANKSDKSGPCASPVPMANGRCRAHGGATPSGIASPHFKHGRYSQSIPARLSERYQEAIADPDILNMVHEIGVLDAHLGDVLSRIDVGEGGTPWKRLTVVKGIYLEASTEEARTAAAVRLCELIDAGFNEDAAYRQVRAILQERAVLVCAQAKRQLELGQSISVSQMMVLLGAVSGCIKEAMSLVTDPEERKSVLDKLSRDLAALVKHDD